MDRICLAGTDLPTGKTWEFEGPLSHCGHEDDPVSQQSYLIDGDKGHEEWIAHLSEVRELYEDELSYCGKIEDVHIICHRDVSKGSESKE